MNSFYGKGYHFCFCLPCCDVWGCPLMALVLCGDLTGDTKSIAFPQGNGHLSVR